MSCEATTQDQCAVMGGFNILLFHSQSWANVALSEIIVCTIFQMKASEHCFQEVEHRKLVIIIGSIKKFPTLPT